MAASWVGASIVSSVIEFWQPTLTRSGLKASSPPIRTIIYPLFLKKLIPFEFFEDMSEVTDNNKASSGVCACEVEGLSKTSGNKVSSDSSESVC